MCFDPRRRQCRSCRAAYMKEYLRKYSPKYYRKNRAEVNSKTAAINKRRRHERYAKIRALQEATPCMDCGQRFPYVVMDFDHRDPSTKTDLVSTLVKRMVEWPKVEAEITKCDIVCACCHRLRTYQGANCYLSHRYLFHRTVVDELKASTPCLDCEQYFTSCQMDFDHHPSGDKCRNVSQLIAGAQKKLLAEIAKCQLVCANCHRIRTHTGERKPDSKHGAMLVARFKEIASRTDYPQDKRQGDFPFPELLGTMTDQELADRIGKALPSRRTFKSEHFNYDGISKEMVAYYRRQAGIPPFKPAPKTAPQPWHKLLGTMPDVEVAEIAGRSPATIHYHRTRLGIPTFEARVQ